MRVYLDVVEPELDAKNMEILRSAVEMMERSGFLAPKEQAKWQASIRKWQAAREKDSEKAQGESG